MMRLEAMLGEGCQDEPDTAAAGVPGSLAASCSQQRSRGLCSYDLGLADDQCD
jgi:hypothetical protein